MWPGKQFMTVCSNRSLRMNAKWSFLHILPVTSGLGIFWGWECILDHHAKQTLYFFLLSVVSKAVCPLHICSVQLQCLSLSVTGPFIGLWVDVELYVFPAHNGRIEIPSAWKAILVLCYFGRDHHPSASVAVCIWVVIIPGSPTVMLHWNSSENIKKGINIIGKYMQKHY